MKIYQNITELIGRTPLVRLNAYEKSYAPCGRILAKLESFNPAGSAKDRVAARMLADAAAEGKLTADSVIIEPTSGNTGIGLAAVAGRSGYRVILTMPDSMSIERRTLLKAYGAEIVLTPAEAGMQGAIEKAEELAREIPHSFIPGQFVSPANPAAHYASTGPEIWEDTDGQIDCFIAGIGTGGTITGVGTFLREKKPDIEIIGVEPAGSPVLSGGEKGPHGLQGIGAGFIPNILKTDIYNSIMKITEEEAYHAARKLARAEGFLVGISSGAALYAATEYAKKPENHHKTIVVLLPDTGDRYLSTPLFSAE